MEIAMKGATFFAIAALVTLACAITADVRRHIQAAREKQEREQAAARSRSGMALFCSECNGHPMQAFFLATCPDGVSEYEAVCPECGASICVHTGLIEQFEQRLGSRVEVVCQRP